MNVVLTELSLLCKLYRLGLLKYFQPNELSFYLTGFCYEDVMKVPTVANDRQIAVILTNNGMLTIPEHDGVEMTEIVALHNYFRPKFAFKTASALFFAKKNNFALITDDALVRDVAQSNSIKSHDNEWLVGSLIADITTMGVPIDKDLVMEFFQ